ncbi:winged helix DNA-binding domain-containing protein, partial [Ramicandelaber brevisporus]
ILDDSNAQGYIKWSDDGLNLVIVDIEKLEKTVMIQHFKHSKLSSFVRQLNQHGFRKIKVVIENGSETYHHPHFQRDKPELMVHIMRK